MVDALTTVLMQHPDASLGDLARAVGVSRTTLHRRFATREDVMRAIAHRALTRLSAAYAEAELHLAFTGADAHALALAETDIAAIRAAIEHLIPAGPSLTFLLRASELADDAALQQRVRDVDAPMLRALERGLARGALTSTGGADWLLESLYALVYIAWEQIERGSLAPRHATELVLTSWLRGAAAADTR